MKLNKKIKLLIAVDGGAASGKSTAAKLLSKKYNLNFLSSGLLYRYVAFHILKKQKIKNQNSFLKKIIKEITPNKLKNISLFNIKTTNYVSKIAKIKKIRNMLKFYQKNFSKKRLVCIEGRDIGTVICPNADIKFFFKCSLKTRAKRRWREFTKINKNISLPEVQKALKIRDLRDTQRTISPLRPARDSILIDTSKINKKQMLVKISRIVENKIKEKYGRNS